MFDSALKQTCDHYVGLNKYLLDSCPRCLGRGIYYDLNFNAKGLIDTVDKGNKLNQEIEKILVTRLGSNKFHLEYGSLLMKASSLGVDSVFRETVLKQSITSALRQLRSYQQSEVSRGKFFTPEELLSQIRKVEVRTDRNDPRRIDIVVEVLTESFSPSRVELELVV